MSGELNDFSSGYTVEKLIADLNAYFDNAVDFNQDKIRRALSSPDALQNLIDRALKNKTHPVNELICDMLRDSSNGFTLGKIEN